MKYKVGDRVMIKPLFLLEKEYGIQKNSFSTFVENDKDFSTKYAMTNSMLKECGKDVIIDYVNEATNNYIIKESVYTWEDWMFIDKPVENIKNLLREIS